MQKNVEFSSFSVDAYLSYARDLGQHLGHCPSCTMAAAVVVFTSLDYHFKLTERNGQKKRNFFLTGRKIFSKQPFIRFWPITHLASREVVKQNFFFFSSLIMGGDKTGLRMAFGKPGKVSHNPNDATFNLFSNFS